MDFIQIARNLRELALDDNYFCKIDFQFLNDLPNLKSLSLKNIQPGHWEFFDLDGMEVLASNLTEHDLEHLDMGGTGNYYFVDILFFPFTIVIDVFL